MGGNGSGGRRGHLATGRQRVAPCLERRAVGAALVEHAVLEVERAGGQAIGALWIRQGRRRRRTVVDGFAADLEPGTVGPVIPGEGAARSRNGRTPSSIRRRALRSRASGVLVRHSRASGVLVRRHVSSTAGAGSAGPPQLIAPATRTGIQNIVFATVHLLRFGRMGPVRPKTAHRRRSITAPCRCSADRSACIGTRTFGDHTHRR